MVFELMLVVAVLALAGVAIYQAGHRPKTASTTTQAPAPTSAQGLAAAAAAVGTQEAATDASLSTQAETSANEVSAMDADVTNLGGASDDAF